MNSGDGLGSAWCALLALPTLQPEPMFATLVLRWVFALGFALGFCLINDRFIAHGASTACQVP